MGYVIHVDNSGFFRKLMHAFRAGLEYECDGYSRGEDALDKAMARHVDCVITGLELSDMPGIDFIKQLAVSVPLVPIIVITSRNDEGEFRHLETLGVKSVIQKTANWKTELHEQLTLIREDE